LLFQHRHLIFLYTLTGEIAERLQHGRSDQSYSVKVKRCDEDHQKLFALINALHDAMRVGKGRSVLQQIIGKLSAYTQTHFQAEEALMEQANYPALSGHPVEHQRFVARVAEFQKDLNAGAGGNSVAVLDFLKDWLAKHIKKLDQSYSSHLNANGIH
jgi:hemerythrin